MILTLTAVSLNDRPLSPALTARFDDHGGTIGRADHNTLALPDPDRFISRLQAEVVASGSSFLIRNVGSSNAIQVGARTLSDGQSAVLQQGDVVRMGGYVLHVEVQAHDGGADITHPKTPARAPARGQPAPPGPAAQVPLQGQPVAGLSSDNPFADLLGTGAGSSQDALADLFGSSAGLSGAAVPPRAELPPFRPAPAGIAEGSGALGSPAAGAPGHRLPDDFDPFAAPSRATPAAAPAAAVDPFAELMASVPAAGIDDAFGLSDSRQGDPLADFLGDGDGPVGQQGGPAISTDPLLLFGSAPTVATPAAPAQPDDVPALHAAYHPPRVLPRQAAAPARPLSSPVPPPLAVPSADEPPAPQPVKPSPVAQAAPSTSGQDDAQALWAAFCAGAGVALPLPAGDEAERMRAIGSMLRRAVDGTLQLMTVRASTKHELRADVTMIQPRNNNPLKFSPDATSGIEQLLQPPARGFLDGPNAIEEVMHDLVGHSIGTVAGMRAAIEGMLGRFDPAALESKLAASSMLDSLLPMNRRARLWDLYLQHHAAIRDQAQEDFHTLFGKAFLAAYEQQIERLRLQKQR